MERTIPQAIAASAERNSYKTAIIYENKKISYLKLIKQALTFAETLNSVGVRSGDCVAVYLSNRPEYAVSVLAALHLGAQIVPLNTRLSPDEIHYILNDSGTKLLITETQFIETAKATLHRKTPVQRTLNIDEKTEEIERWSCSEDSSLLSVFKSTPSKPDSVALIAYTSGTTGQLKGAQLTHKNLLSNAYACLKTIPIKPNENFLCILPLAHTFPFTVCLLTPLLSGTTTTMLASVKPFKRVMKAVFKNRVTIFVGIPQLYRALTNAPRPGFFSRMMFRLFNPLRFCISGADPLPLDVLVNFENRFRVPLLEGYGLTEASPVVSFNRLENRKKSSVGLPLEGVEIRIISEKGEPVPRGEIGELCVKGDNVMLGYLNRPKETCECIKEGWLLTGDMAKLDEDGFIYIVGRKKDMISVKGLKLYPQEVEAVLLRHPSVEDCVVVGVSDSHSGEVPVAAVVLAKDCRTSSEELLSYMRNHIADYKLPRKIVFTDSLPKTATAKVRRYEIRALFTSQFSL